MEMNVAVLQPRVREDAPRVTLRWGGRAICAVLDQACFAGSGFVVNILLARWLTSEAFGSFAVAYSTFFFLGTLYTQLLTAPMLVFGAGKYADRFRGYLGVLVCGHIMVAGGIGLALAAAAAALTRLGSPAGAQAFSGLALAAPFILLLWLGRSALYAQMRPQWAAVASAMHLLLVAAGIHELHRLHLLSSTSGFLTMGASALFVGFLIIVKLRPRWRLGAGRRGTYLHAWLRLVGLRRGQDRGRLMTARLAMVVRDHCQYAKWSSAASATGWLVGNLHYFVLSATAGLSSVAAMRALDTALSPYFHFQLALSRLLIPVLGARVRSRSNDLFPYVLRASALWAGLALVAYVFVRAFAPEVISLLYGAAYGKYSRFLEWYALIMIAIALADPMLSFLTALVRTDLVFIYHLLFSGVLLAGYLAAGRYGVPGIISVLIVVNCAMVPVAIISARRAWATRRSSMVSPVV